MIISLVFISLIILLTAISHILLKKGSGSASPGDPTGRYLNRYTLTGYLIFGIVTILGVEVLRLLPLKLFCAFSALTYIAVLALSGIILGEPVNRRQYLAVTLITLGIVIFNIEFL